MKTCSAFRSRICNPHVFTKFGCADFKSAGRQFYVHLQISKIQNGRQNVNEISFSEVCLTGMHNLWILSDFDLSNPFLMYLE